jgi:pyruvate dehydrogenase E2 component (dihydrolipoamide acetyltransferase)
LATNVVMPALGMAQDTGKLIEWLKAEGETVQKGEPLMMIETDKVTVEIEAPASGVLANVSAKPGSDIRVGHTIAQILAPGESVPTPEQKAASAQATTAKGGNGKKAALPVSPVAARIAAEHNLDLSLVKARGNRIEKADVLAFLDTQTKSAPQTRLATPASPKARRLAAERGIDVTALQGSGPNGAVLAADVLGAAKAAQPSPLPVAAESGDVETPSTIWCVMAERMTESWTSAPHFYLVREVAASGLVELRARITPIVEKRNQIKPTYTDLLVKLIATELRDHPRLNASWVDGGIRRHRDINIGVATAIEEGLIVPVIHHADQLGLGELAARRRDLTERAQAGKLSLSDISDGTFTLTNLGMYNVDAFNAIINAPQAAILAVGRIAERVVAVGGQPAVRPMLTLTLGCDHRVVDGARAAQFLDDLANLIVEPWGLLA